MTGEELIGQVMDWMVGNDATWIEAVQAVVEAEFGLEKPFYDVPAPFYDVPAESEV